jgi:4-carboxymuconolactone decarboxylase
MKGICVALLLAVGWPMTAAAQDRLPPIPPDKMTPEQRQAVEEFRAARNADVSGPFMPLLRSPEVMNRARAMGDYLRFKSVFPPRLSEFAILITARQWTQNYEWDAHYQLALKGGLREDIARAVARTRPERMADDGDLYNFCTGLQHKAS